MLTWRTVAETNPNQVKILQCGVLPALALCLESKVTFLRFISCPSRVSTPSCLFLTPSTVAGNAIANLAACGMCCIYAILATPRYPIFSDPNTEANRAEVVASGLLPHLIRFTRNTPFSELMDAQIYDSWLGLAPHTGLLPSSLEEVQEFALFNLCHFSVPSRKEKYEKMLWRDLSMVDGPTRIQDLAESKNPEIASLAARLMRHLDITPKLPFIRNPKARTPASCVAFGDSDLFDSAQFCDVRVGAEGREISAHKVILASRCPYFRAMFSSGLLEAEQNSVIQISNVSFETLSAVIRFVYTGIVRVEVSTAVGSSSWLLVSSCCDTRL